VFVLWRQWQSSLALINTLIVVKAIEEKSTDYVKFDCRILYSDNSTICSTKFSHACVSMVNSSLYDLSFVQIRERKSMNKYVYTF
jgi:hypothetical protein